MYKLFIFICILCSNTFAINESESLIKMKEMIDKMNFQCTGNKKNTTEAFWKLGKFSSEHPTNLDKVYSVRYSKFGCGSGTKGALVIAPGRTESSLKYMEAAYDFIKRGYSPVYAIDHRGQGFSPRALQNTDKGHIEYFKYFVNDFEAFVNNVVLKDEDIKENAKNKRLFLISNSMGGAISTRYLQRVGKRSPFKKTVLFGPMIQIDFSEQTVPSEHITNLVTGTSCLINMQVGPTQKCYDYSKIGWEDYDSTARNFDPTNPEGMTHSKNRYEYRNWLWDTLYSKNGNLPPLFNSTENWNGLQVGGPTTRWIWQSTKANILMRSLPMLSRIHTKYRIITGAKDLRAVIPKHKSFCKNLNRSLKYKNIKNGCRFITIENAYHELLIEEDQYRNIALQEVWSFFEEK